MLFPTLLFGVAAAADDTLYGVCSDTAAAANLERIDASTAARTPLGTADPNEVLGQQLSAIDAKRGILYSIVFDVQTEKAAVQGFALKDGSSTVNIALPFDESAFVGVGQRIGVDPLNGKGLSVLLWTARLSLRATRATAHALRHLLLRHSGRFRNGFHHRRAPRPSG